MRILVTGACGFVGSALIRGWADSGAGHRVFGLDNLVRGGSEKNRGALAKLGAKLFHGDIRMASDFETLPEVDWVIDAAANPSVMAGVDGKTSSRQLLEHNLLGTLNMLEFCKSRRAGFILLSTSRVYAISALAALPLEASGSAFRPKPTGPFPPGFGARGVREEFSTEPPISLYGASKAASEALALEYGRAFGFPVWINRCGVMAGAGQFGHAEQGIFSYWINSWRAKRPLRYIGFGGAGRQVRDCLHPLDLLPLLKRQMSRSGDAPERVFNIAGGIENSMSLSQLSEWCRERFGPLDVASDARERPFDVPWLVLDSSKAGSFWGWRPERGIEDVLGEIADFAEKNPDWLSLSGAHA